MKASIGRNRQAIVNIFAMYLVLNYAIYNYKVKLAWEEFQTDFDVLTKEHVGLKERLLDETFLKKIEESLEKAGKGEQGKGVQAAIADTIDSNAAMYRKERQEAGAAVTADDDGINVLASAMAGSSTATGTSSAGINVANLGASSSSTGRII